MEVFILPFLKPKQSVGIIVSKRMSDGSPKEESSDPSEDSAMEACARDLIRGISMKDEKLVAQALKSAHQCAESEPHDEQANDYDSLNQLAAKKEDE